MAIFTKADLELVPKTKSEVVKVGELEFKIQELTAGGHDEYEASLIKGKGKARDVDLMDLRAKLVVLSVVDEAGNRVFASHEVGIVSAWPSDVVDVLYKAIKVLNRMDMGEEAGK